MWKAFEGSFTKALRSVLNYDEAKAKDVAAKAEKKYIEIVKGLPEFEKGDSFKVNILSCAMFCAYCLNMEKMPDLDTLTLYYEKAMMNPLMKVYCRIQGLNKFSWRGYFAVEKMARAEYGSRNPYSWTFRLFLCERPIGRGFSTPSSFTLTAVRFSILQTGTM